MGKWQNLAKIFDEIKKTHPNYGMHLVVGDEQTLETTRN
jgi:hypothetical protein